FTPAYALQVTGNGHVQLHNTGHIIGMLLFADGADLLDSSKGTLNAPVYMGGGNDTVKGSAGADTVVGGLGQDTMTGGAGADHFVFTATNESGLTNALADRITDFSHAQKDRIDLTAIDAISGGSNDKFTFIAKSAFSHHAGQLHYSVSGGNAYVS